MLNIDEDLKSHILQHYAIQESDLTMLLDDLGEYWNRSIQDYVQARHLELQKRGMKNQDIYRQILLELPARRFAAPELSERQIRRMIYG